MIIVFKRRYDRDTYCKDRGVHTNSEANSILINVNCRFHKQWILDVIVKDAVSYIASSGERIVSIRG